MPKLSPFAVVCAAVLAWSEPAAGFSKTYATKGAVWEFNPGAGDGTARPMIASGIMGALGCGAKAIGLGDEAKLLARCQQSSPLATSWPEQCDLAGLTVALKERYAQNWVYGAHVSQESAFAEMLGAAAQYGAPSIIPLYGTADRWATLIKFTVDITPNWVMLSKLWYYDSTFDAETQLHVDGLRVVSGEIFRNIYYKSFSDATIAPNDTFRGKFVHAHDPPENVVVVGPEVGVGSGRGGPLLGAGEVLTVELAEALALDALDLEDLLTAPELAMVRRVGVPDGAWAVEAELTDGAPWSYFVVPIRDSETGAMLAFVGLAAADGAFEQLHLLRHPAALQFVDPDAAAAAARTAFGAEIISDGLLRWRAPVGEPPCGAALQPYYEFTVGEGRRVVRVPLVQSVGAAIKFCIGS